MRAARIVAIAALVFLALSAIVGAIPLVMHANEDPSAMPQGLLRDSPFHSYLVPGIVLLVANGLLSLWVLWVTVYKRPGYGWWVTARRVPPGRMAHRRDGDVESGGVATLPVRNGCDTADGGGHPIGPEGQQLAVVAGLLTTSRNATRSKRRNRQVCRGP
jgi:hypothetical protein